MKRCESCGAENSAQATFCAKCGKKLQNKEYSGRAAERESALSEDTIVFSEPIVAKTSSAATSSSSQPELESEKTELAEQDVDLLYTGPRQAASARKTAQSTRDAVVKQLGTNLESSRLKNRPNRHLSKRAPRRNLPWRIRGVLLKKNGAECAGIRTRKKRTRTRFQTFGIRGNGRESRRQEGPQSELDELLAQEDAFSAQGSSSQTGRGRIVLFAVLATVVVSICAVCAVVFFSLGQEPPVSDQTEPTQTVEEPQTEPEPEQTQPETQTRSNPNRNRWSMWTTQPMPGSGCTARTVPEKRS